MKIDSSPGNGIVRLSLVRRGVQRSLSCPLSQAVPLLKTGHHVLKASKYREVHMLRRNAKYTVTHTYQAHTHRHRHK